MPTWTDYPPVDIEPLEEQVDAEEEEDDDDDEDGPYWKLPCNLWFFNVSDLSGNLFVANSDAVLFK